MAVFIQRDVVCNKCGKTYPTYTGERELAVLYSHTFLSVCPECTKEICALMGYTPENITKHLGGIKEAETENNRRRRIEDGRVCKKCEKPIPEGIARVRESIASNVESWHLDCYGS